jgi:hypothetical protein
MFKYGRGRGQVMARDRHGIRPAYLVAPLNLLYVASSPLLALLTPWALLPLGVYLVGVLAGACGVSFQLRRPTAIPLATALIVTVHACYGAGIIVGLFRRRRASRWAERPAGAALEVGERPSR